MASVFKKLICKEFGEPSYNKYFFCYQKLISNRTYDSKRLDNEEIYNDMYQKLRGRDIHALKTMMERLSDSMFVVLRISKTFKFVAVIYLVAVIFLLCQGLTLWVGVVSVLLTTVCFLYKLYEYIVNKYCFIDAHIVIVYKTVLDRLILNYELTNLK